MKRLSFPHWVFLASLLSISCLHMHGFISLFLIPFSLSMYLFYQYHWVVFFFYNNRIIWKRNKIIPFTIVSETIKYLGINSPRKWKIHTSKTIRHWWKKLKIQINGKVLACSWTGRVTTIKNAHTTQRLLQIQCSPYQNFNGTTKDLITKAISRKIKTRGINLLISKYITK